MGGSVEILRALRTALEDSAQQTEDYVRCVDKAIKRLSPGQNDDADSERPSSSRVKVKSSASKKKGRQLKKTAAKTQSAGSTSRTKVRKKKRRKPEQVLA
jgi:hypothetical protein